MVTPDESKTIAQSVATGAPVVSDSLWKGIKKSKGCGCRTVQLGTVSEQLDSFSSGRKKEASKTRAARRGDGRNWRIRKKSWGRLGSQAESKGGNEEGDEWFFLRWAGMLRVVGLWQERRSEGAASRGRRRGCSVFNSGEILLLSSRRFTSCGARPATSRARLRSPASLSLSGCSSPLTRLDILLRFSCSIISFLHYTRLCLANPRPRSSCRILPLLSWHRETAFPIGWMHTRPHTADKRRLDLLGSVSLDTAGWSWAGPMMPFPPIKPVNRR
jgi:hypothetical protein